MCSTPCSAVPPVPRGAVPRTIKRDDAGNAASGLPLADAIAGSWKTFIVACRTEARFRQPITLPFTEANWWPPARRTACNTATSRQCRRGYGRDFSYEETGLTRSGFGGWFAAMRDTVFGRLFLKSMARPAIRAWLQKNVLPKSGEGPTKEVRETGSYEIMLVGTARDGEILKVRICGQGDPGVRLTTLMLTEAAMCLAEDASNLPVGGGFCTLASAMGPIRRHRITRHAGLTFTVFEAEEGRAKTRRG